MNVCISFRCSSCRARIKAPLQLSGQARLCPGCGNPFVVPPAIPEDAGPHLLLDDRTIAAHARAFSKMSTQPR